MEITLKVEPAAKDRFRLKINENDKQAIEIVNASKVIVEISENKDLIVQPTAIHTYKTYGTLNSSEINEWIQNHNFHNYEKGNPTPLIFEFRTEGSIHCFRFLSN